MKGRKQKERDKEEVQEGKKVKNRLGDSETQERGRKRGIKG